MIEGLRFFEVHGRVTGKGGREVSGAQVIVWWQHIRERFELAAGKANEDGSYRLRYQVPASLTGALLVVVDARSQHLEEPITSQVMEAVPDLLVDLRLETPDRSEWATLVSSIQPLLDGLELTDIVENDEHEDVTFLARELARDAESIMRAAVAARMEAASSIPGAVFYAFLRQHVPASLPGPLLEASQGFAAIDALVRRLASLIGNLTPDLQKRTIASAITKKIIGPQFGAQIEGVVGRLQAQRTANLLAQPYVVGKATLGQLLALAKLPESRQQAFVQALVANTQSMRGFWRTLGDGKHGFTAEEASAIERTLTVGMFVKNHVPLMTVLLARLSSGTYASVHDLARLQLKEWIDLVTEVGPPPTIDPAGGASPVEGFARVIYARVTRAFPTVALASRVARTQLLPPPERAPLDRFFVNNSGLNLVRNNLTAYLEHQGDSAFTGIEAGERRQVVANARRLQRVLLVTTNVDSAEALLGLGLHSATQVAMMGRQPFFLAATRAGLSKSEANRLYGRSSRRYAGVVSLYTQLNRGAIGIWPTAIGQTTDLEKPMSDAILRDESLATLFGSQDYCATDSCTSILSPAAYLCDLLYWLRHRITGPKSAFDVINGRRPDIGNLKLNCPNTETPVPYIDLVNEILADAISPPADPNSTINPPWKQTSEGKSAAELRASPEYFNQGAYATLFAASYPHSLPYSEGLDELRAYLQQSGIALRQLRQALLPLRNPTTAQAVAVAAERFGMGPRDVDLITQADFVNANTAWNIPLPGDPRAVLAALPAFLQAAGVTYEQVLELLQVAWVQQGVDLTLLGLDDTCDTSKQTLNPAPIDAGLLDRAHRFLRLWRRTGYAMWELDMLLGAAAVANGALDAAGLIALSTFRELQDATGLSVDRQLAFFQAMDTASHRGPDGEATTSLYARVFLNPAVASQHPDADLVAVATGGVLADPPLTNHLDAIQAALGVSATDAAALVALLALSGPNTLTLANLSLLYRVNQLASAAGLSLAALTSVATLVNPGAANPAAAVGAAFASPAAMLAFLGQVAAIQRSGFSLDTLVYLLTPPPWTTATGMTDSGIAAVLAAVRQAILNPSGGDVDGSVTAAVAGQMGLANDVTAFLVQRLNVPLTAQTLLASLTDPSLTSPPGGPFPPLTRAGYPSQYLAVQLLDKAALVVQRLHLVAADLSWLVTNAGVYGGLDFSSLPVAGGQAAPGAAPLLTTVLLVMLARSFGSAPPQSQITTLYDLIGGVHDGTIADEASAQVALATISGWTLADIATLAGTLGVSFALGDYARPATYDALRGLEAMIGATGGKAKGDQLVSWGQVPADEAAAEAMAASALSVLKARYSNAQWLPVAPSSVDPIREHRSAALQAYLVAERDAAGKLVYGDSNGLFDHFLIDVQMSACEVTTRVVQAYIAVQIFVERCRMGSEAPDVVVDLAADDGWEWWQWMERYRIWQAAREVFLYPENWLIESQRPNRTEIFKKLEQEVRQGEHTSDYFETVALNYVDRLDGVSNLLVTGTCQDPRTGAVHVVARALEDPPQFYTRSLANGEWTGWEQVPLNIKAHHVVPAIYRGRLCLFWPEVKVAKEPRQDLPAAQPSSSPPSQEVAKYVSIGLDFTIFRNGAWAPAQKSKGKLFDAPYLPSDSVSDSTSVEALYTLKVQAPAPTPGYGATLFVDVFRLGDVVEETGPWISSIAFDPTTAVHLGRAVFDGRFTDLELRNVWSRLSEPLLTHAQNSYGPDAQPLLLLPDGQADPDLVGEPGLVPVAGALATAAPNSSSTLPLVLTSVGLEQPPGPLTLLDAASVPFRIVGPASDLGFDPAAYFFYQDNRRCYYVDTRKFYWTGSTWAPNPPSNPATAPFEARYTFHRFYHPYTRLIWHQLAGGGFPTLYDRRLQLEPDQIDPSHADLFSFQNTYRPVTPRVSWGEDNEILDFTPAAAYSIYNWEIFFHAPLYAAQLLSQNQQFETAQSWYHYIFDPTRQGPDPAPQRFWITKPLYNLTSADILKQRINNLLLLVNAGDADALNQVARWQGDPFNPFLLADLRPVAYMKATVMGYLDNLIAWADNLFATDSREALSEATLLYVIAAETLGPQPTAIAPPEHADDSYNDLAPKLDAFANAMVEIENVMGQGGGGGGGQGGGQLPGPQTFYFKIPPNDKLLGYWRTVGDRLFKLRHCQNIKGVTRQLALFDAPIDPGLLIRARAAGVDIGSVLSDLVVALPNYRFTALYPIALDFVNAVRAYGALLLSAVEKRDAGQLAVMLATDQRQLLGDADQIFAWQVELAEKQIENLNAALDLAQEKYDFWSALPRQNLAEGMAASLSQLAFMTKHGVPVLKGLAAVLHALPNFGLGVAGFGGSPSAGAHEGGSNAGHSSDKGAEVLKEITRIMEDGAKLAAEQGRLDYRYSDNQQKAAEAQIQVQQTQIQIAAAQLALEIAQQNQTNHQTQLDQLQAQIDFLTGRFTNQDLYDWMAAQLSDTYFQSYKLAYKLCKQVERCYRYELGIPDSDFIHFGYWDSLRKGLLAGETLNHDLRRMQAAYLEGNSRRFEISRFISLAAVNPGALQQLLQTGACDFDLPESLFDRDYPGHYSRHLLRVSVTVSYPNPGKFDNVKATLTLTQNKVRTTADLGGGYAETPPGGDARFAYNYAAVPQKIALGNAQDDPGLFLTSITNNLSDARYLPFEGGGAVSSWHFEMPAANNEINLANVTDVILHLYYTAIDGGDNLKQAVENG